MTKFKFSFFYASGALATVILLPFKSFEAAEEFAIEAAKSYVNAASYRIEKNI